MKFVHATYQEICALAKARWHQGKRRQFGTLKGTKFIRFPKCNRGHWYVDGAKRTRKDIGI
jgi:hypothetical protein